MEMDKCKKNTKRCIENEAFKRCGEGIVSYLDWEDLLPLVSQRGIFCPCLRHPLGDWLENVQHLFRRDALRLFSVQSPLYRPPPQAFKMWSRSEVEGRRELEPEDKQGKGGESGDPESKNPLEQAEWRALLEEYAFGRESSESLLESVDLGPLDGQSVKELVEYVENVLRNPNLLVRSLVRETMDLATNTIFQAFLGEEIYKETNEYFFEGSFTSNMDAVERGRKIIGKVRAAEVCERVISSAADIPTVLSKSRWYETERESESLYLEEDTPTGLESGVEDSMSKCSINPLKSLFGSSYKSMATPGSMMGSIRSIRSYPLLFLLLERVDHILRTFCQMNAKLLLEMKDKPLELIQKYSEIWDAYTHSAIHLNIMLEDLAYLLNQAYEKGFPGYPCFPKFSIWRLMVHRWNSIVFTRIQKYLQRGLLDLLLVYREKQTREITQKQKTQKKEKNPIGSLFGNLGESASSSSSSSSKVHKLGMNMRELENRRIESCLRKCINGFVDISTNELSVHWWNHSSFPLEGRYLELHENIQRQTIQMIKQRAKTTLQLGFETFSEILDADRRTMSRILPPVTQRLVEEESLQQTLNAAINRAKKVLRKEGPKTINNNIFNTGECVYAMRIDLQKEDLGISDLELDSFFYGGLLLKRPELVKTYEKCKEELGVSACPLSDLEREYINNAKGIPKVLSPEEVTMYSLSSPVTSAGVQIIYDKYKHLHLL